MYDLCEMRIAIIELLEQRPMLFTEIVDHLGEDVGEHLHKLVLKRILKKEASEVGPLYTIRDPNILEIKNDLKRYIGLDP
jgi:hypothetical protein